MSLMQRPDTMQARLAEAEARIERLQGAMAADSERLERAGRRVGIKQGCDTAEWMADTIERLEAENARLTKMVATWEHLMPMSRWAVTPDEADQVLPRHYVPKGMYQQLEKENARLREAGRIIRDRDRDAAASCNILAWAEKYLEACRVFEEER